MSKPQIKKVEVYRIRHDGRYHYRATKEGAASKLAWSMVAGKYNLEAQYQTIFPEDLKYPPGLECECYDSGAAGEPYNAPWGICEIHCRETGYYKRVHDRLARWILAGME